ncbi:MAG: hypothetical protein E7099_00465 [Mediterranea massiliensis]|nr:hypothetical protein [Mediterranea massiliensis]
MPIFAIYEYKLSKGEFVNHFFSNDKETDDKLPKHREREDYFGSFFKQKKMIVYAPEATSKKSNYSPNYTIDVIANYDNITLLTIENNKVKHTTENKQDVEHEHHPFCHIAIDNREGHCLIAIEKSSAFDGKPERVCKIFVEGMNNEMAKDKINNPKVPTTNITYKEKLKKKEVFWDTVHEIKQLFNDSVKQIKLDFDRSKVKNNNVNPNSLMALITSMATKSNTDASVSFNSDTNDEVRLDEIREDLVQMAKVCLEQKEYDLMVKFRTFGIYKFGADVKAQFGIDDSALEKFSVGEKELDEDNPDNGNFAFVKWLDRISILLKDYEDKKPILKRRARSRRR